MQPFLMRGCDAGLGRHKVGQRRIAGDRDRGCETRSGRCWRGTARAGRTWDPRRQLLPDVKHAQVSCVAVVRRDGVILAPRAVRDHRTVGEEHQVIPRQRNALAPRDIIEDQRGSDCLLPLSSVSISRTGVPIWKCTPLPFSRLQGLDDRVVLVVLGVDDHRQLEQRLADVHGEAGQVAPALDQGMLGGHAKM